MNIKNVLNWAGAVVSVGSAAVALAEKTYATNPAITPQQLLVAVVFGSVISAIGGHRKG